MIDPIFMMKLLELLGLMAAVCIVWGLIGLYHSRHPSASVRLTPRCHCEGCGRMLYRKEEAGEFVCLTCDREAVEVDG